MSVNVQQRDAIELAFLFAVGTAISIGGVLFMERVPQIAFPYNLNLFFWSLFFILTGLLPATFYVCEDREPRALAVALFVGGGGGAVLAPQVGVVGDVIYLDGVNVMLFVMILLGTVPLILYSGQATKLILGSVMGLMIAMYLFVLIYIASAFMMTRDAVTFVPLLGATIIIAATLSVFWKAYKRTGF